MSNEIEAIANTNEIGTKRIKVNNWGLEIEGQITPQEWVDAAISVQRFDGRIQWYLGDLAEYAESPVTGWDTKRKEENGEKKKNKYDEMIDMTGYDYGTLSDAASMSRRFPASFREKISVRTEKLGNLSWNHFRVVRSLEDSFAEYWLVKASENGWGYRKLRDELKKEYGDDAVKEEKPVGEVTFNDQLKTFFKGYVIDQNKSYDDVSWLLEVHDVIEEKLSHDYGIEL